MVRNNMQRWAKSAIGDMNQAELSRRLTEALGRSIDRAAVNKVLTGGRDLKADEMLEIARITKAPVPARPPRVPIVGFVGAGAEAHFYGEGQGTGEEVEHHGANESTVAVEIRGDSLGQFFDRWLAFYDDIRVPFEPSLFGELCVVGLDTGGVLIKKVEKGARRGRYTLLAQVGSPIYDARIEWAAAVKAMAPR